MSDEKDPLAGPPFDLPPPDFLAPPPLSTPKVWAQPIVDEIAPEGGPVLGGTRVTLTGKHLFRVSIVRFGGELAQTIGAREPHEIKVLSPPRKEAGVVDVTVENPAAPMAIKPKAFTYAALPAPVIDSVAPREAAAAKDSKLSVHGKNFLAASEVLVGDAPVKKVTFIDAGTLEIVVAGGKSGAMMDVMVVNPDGKRVSIKRAFKFT
jgi:hypothetical protein